MLGEFYADIRADRMAALSDAVAAVTGTPPRPFAAFAAEIAPVLGRPLPAASA
jgi:hypothetical protein